MVDLGCLDTDWVGGNDKDVLDAIFLQDHTRHFEHGQRKKWLSWVHFWLVLGPKGAPRVTDGGLSLLGYSLGRRK